MCSNPKITVIFEIRRGLIPWQPPEDRAHTTEYCTLKKKSWLMLYIYQFINNFVYNSCMTPAVDNSSLRNTFPSNFGPFQCLFQRRHVACSQERRNSLCRTHRRCQAAHQSCRQYVSPAETQSCVNAWITPASCGCKNAVVFGGSICTTTFDKRCSYR